MTETDLIAETDGRGRGDPFQVGFVCAGNICRSPYAEGYLRKLVTDRGWQEKVRVSSAGILEIDGARAAETTRQLAAEEGVDLEAHRSQGTSEAYLQGCDLVLTMEPEQAALLRKVYPESAERIFLLTAYPSPRIDTDEAPDPVGQEVAMFRQVHAQIRDAMTPVLEELAAIVEGRQ